MDFNIRGVEIHQYGRYSLKDRAGIVKLFYSCTFTSFIYTYLGQYVSKYKLAKDACTVEIEKLGPAYWQTRSICGCFRRTKFFEFLPNGFVNVEPIIMLHSSYKRLEENLMMFYLGGIHNSSEILKEQSKI